MFDAITNFISYLKESIENSNDPEEIERLESVLEKAERIKEKIDSVSAARVQV
ncbi:MAG TPA: hypothetical protein VMV68_04085 [Spirochaetia bacterium]|nr:hypothetical protein [Spirochaetia bacterium]